ncbi:MAG TPA: Ni/Fe hydrogenase subunit alpha, partial [Thermoanaerobaculia bacterium]|nr:Ni/Fe hydrogenase subunit alpha [Thermoanaerobaculia bacterium]
MSEVATTSRAIRVECLTRVEGEGGLTLRVADGKLEDVRVDIFEPPRLFEGFLKGRHFSEVPDLTARICGICPVAYQMSSVHAIESALGVSVTPEIRALRRLLYCAEWIQSHALHIFLLQAPDFLGFESAITMAKEAPELVEKGLRLKKLGNRLMETLGGRASHPVSVCVGGFHKAPARRELDAFRDELGWAIDAAVDTVALVSGLAFPDLEPEYEFVSVAHPVDYPMNERAIVSSAGLSIDPEDYEDHFIEEQVEHSTALHSVRAGSGASYFVGPLARLTLHAEKLTPRARSAAEAAGIAGGSRNPFRGIVARAVELTFACEEALALIEAYRAPEPCRVPVTPGGGTGCAATEAPRGTLYHRYRLNSQGLVEAAKIMPPTAQNLRRI